MLLHSMNGGFIFSSQTRAVFSLSLSHSKSMVLIKNSILTMFPSLGNNVKMSVEFEGKQNTWLKFFYAQNPVKQRGLKPHTEANRKSRHLVWKTWINTPSQGKKKKHTHTILKCFVMGSWQAQVLPHLGFIGRFKSKLLNTSNIQVR